MQKEILAFAQEQAQAVVRRAVVPVAFGLVALVFFCFTLVGLLVALFFWLEPFCGPPIAALIVAAVALVIGLIATLPLVIRRRPPPPPPSNSNLPQFVSLVAQSTSSLGPKQTAIAALLLAVGLGLLSRGSSSKKK